MQSIPYDSRLALGNVVDAKTLERVKKISGYTAAADAAQDKLNALILARRSIESTQRELEGITGPDGNGLDVAVLKTEIIELDREVVQAAGDYAKATVDCQQKILTALKEQTEVVDSIVESPIRWTGTTITARPIGANSINLDAQFFSSDQMKALSDHVSSKTAFLGPDRSKEMTGAATAQASGQHQNHKIEGTLVITAACTHKLADILYPLALDPDNAVAAWNAVVKGDPIKPGREVLAELAKEEGKASDSTLEILSGAIYGSSFVGMVHFLKDDSTDAVESLNDFAAKVGPLVDKANWFAQKSGKLGDDNPFFGAVNQMVSNSTIDCHCSLVSMGVIPTLASKGVTQSVHQMSGDSSKTLKEMSATNAMSTIDSESQQGRAAALKLSADMATKSSMLSTLAKTDAVTNQMLDLNSLMTAFDNYVSLINGSAGAAIGVPLRYLIKKIPKSQVLLSYCREYYPELVKPAGQDKDQKK